mmetsp:Transcript_15086/g.44460  ORF Transcript_15086/g.44460 Transcript_15086/m.44460 type:complete len:136 (+) Transcript_15086:461-868(+)
MHAVGLQSHHGGRDGGTQPASRRGRPRSSCSPGGSRVGDLLRGRDACAWRGGAAHGDKGRAKDIWWIQSVYVKPEHRKQGIFRKLYDHTKEEARRAGSCGLRLYADTNNTRAHATYESLGMTSHYQVYESMFTDY